LYQLLKRIGLFIFFLHLHFFANATHYRAGEITYKQVGLLTYEITAITYTDYTKVQADRTEIELFFGDGTSGIVPRSNGQGEIINSDQNNPIKKNIYTTTHTYVGPGSYIISLTDPNRVAGIRNINSGQSVLVPFYVESFLKIRSGFGFNQSPVLLLPPIDIGCKYKIYKHNPAASDPDGDSLVFTLIPPKMAVGVEVPNYEIPEHSTSFTLDPNNGQVVWNAPLYNGPYNIAIKIEEYRTNAQYGVRELIGYVVRDMQIFINEPCNNYPPVIRKFVDSVCIEANQLYTDTIWADDPNTNQKITISKYGGPFVQTYNPAKITPDPSVGFTPVKTVFSWQPSCYAIRYRPHLAVFRAVDNDVSNPLSDIKYLNIRVVGPAPKNVNITQDSNGFVIGWDKDSCSLAFGYKIYRRVDSSYWNHSSCETGVPAYTKFVLIDTTQGINRNSYFDNNHGKGLSPLTRYCYRVTTIYPPRSENGNIIFSEESEGYSSKEVCDVMISSSAIITNVSVLKTDNSAGEMLVKWLKPMILDTTQFPGPYKFITKRAELGSGNYLNVGPEFKFNSFAQLKDTGFVDVGLNTANNEYKYIVELYHTKNSVERYTTQSVAASSVWLSTFNSSRTITLNWKVDVPWFNSEYVVFRKNTSNIFDSIGFSTTNSFRDTGLFNGQTYCYYVKSVGSYNPILYSPVILNNSQEICAVPIDTTKPCQPVLSVETPCSSDTKYNVDLSWVYPSDCDQDVVKFVIYWRKNKTEKWKAIDSTSKNNFAYSDARESLKLSIAGCYAVTAIDSFNNESNIVNEFCIDNCPRYVIPNVFTPNNDFKNDILNPFPYRFVDSIYIVIFNRWAQVVYKTSDKDINWNGKDYESGIDCSDGVYYYICDVFESFLDGTRKRTIKGSIQIIR